MIRAKKHLGQHFLTDTNICKKIADSLTGHGGYKTVLEVGPGMGALTKHLLEVDKYDFYVIEKDVECVEFLTQAHPELKDRILREDFLRFDLKAVTDNSMAIIGNFPYNISSQILFKALENRSVVEEVVGMFQKEVAERVCEKPGTKKYGIISVLLQAYYDIEYLFTVSENVFNPPPKVKSGVIRLKRNNVKKLPCDEQLFKRVVKQSFNQRRKMLRNSLKDIIEGKEIDEDFLNKRPEQLSVEDFVALTSFLQ